LMSWEVTGRREGIEMVGNEVSLFIVIPPADVQVSKERILKALMDRFPGLGFSVLDDDRFPEQDEFAVIPVMGMLGNGDAAEMCEDLPRGLLAEMKAVCEGVDLSGARYLH